MEVEKIYQRAIDNSDEVIYALGSSRKIIKRKKEMVQKLNLSRWEEVSFIPDEFEEVKREVTVEEKKEIKNFLREIEKKDETTILEKVKRKWNTLFK